MCIALYIVTGMANGYGHKLGPEWDGGTSVLGMVKWWWVLDGFAPSFCELFVYSVYERVWCGSECVKENVPLVLIDNEGGVVAITKNKCNALRQLVYDY